MDDSFNGYVEHYTKTKEGLIFLMITLITLVIVLCILYLYTRLRAGSREKSVREQFITDEFGRLSERFYELIFSGGSILFFMAAYYLIERFMYVEPYRSIWEKHNDLILLVLIILSILSGRLMDNVLVRLKKISHEEKTSLRLVGMIYMILIFCYIKFIYEDDNYDAFITYFLGLMIGRFAYFDVSWRDISESLVGAVKNFPLMIIALAYLSALSWYGFNTGFLIKHIGVMTNVFIIHVFMCVAIFVVFYIMKIFNGTKKKRD